MWTQKLANSNGRHQRLVRFRANQFGKVFDECEGAALALPEFNALEAGIVAERGDGSPLDSSRWLGAPVAFLRSRTLRARFD